METPLYEMLVEDEMLDGIFAISLVSEPAIESDFVMLNKDNKIRIDIELQATDNKRHIVTGLALVPDKIITRNGYNIKFSAETIRKLAEKFMIENKKDNVTIQHKASVNKIYLIESWIVDDPEIDKTKFLGISDVPKGSWAVSYKIEDIGLWNEFLQTGILKGFSIEGSFSQREIKMENIDNEIRDLALSFIYHPKYLNTEYKWVMRPDSKYVKNCPICKERNGQVHTLKEWINIGIPGVPENTEVAGQYTKYKTSPYSTYCEDKCNCKLVRVGEVKEEKNKRGFDINILLPWTNKYKIGGWTSKKPEK